jgi:ABC-2 type transport system permease protein
MRQRGKGTVADAATEPGGAPLGSRDWSGRQERAPRGLWGAVAAWRRRVLAVSVRWRGELLRQTELYALAVLGPFLLLGLFAVGFRLSAFRPTGILVTPLGSPEAATIAHLPYVAGLRANISIKGITPDERTALDELRAGDVDMVIVIPSSPSEQVIHGQRATISIYVSVVNPLLRIALYNAVDQQIAGVNDAAVAAAVAGVQSEIESFLPQLDRLNRRLQAIKPGEPPEQTATDLAGIKVELEQIRASAVAAQARQSGSAADLYYAAIISETDQVIAAVQSAEVRSGPRGEQINVAALRTAQERLGALDGFLHQLDTIPARTIAIPFSARITNLAIGGEDLTDFYGPAALALLLQHLAVTLAALSLVRDRELGAIETLAVSPASAAEVLLGRMLFYGLATLATAVALTLLLVFGLHVPFTGPLLLYVLILLLLIWASSAAGFCVALVTRSDAQAVQSIMLLLVGAIFFSGFIGPLRALTMPAAALADVFPLTYAIDALDHIMLLGNTPPLGDFLGLGALGAGLSVLAWLLLRRELAPH